MALLFARPIPTETVIEIDGRPLRVAVRTHARARNYRLSIPHTGEPVLTLPPNGKWKEAEAFLARHRNWLAARLGRSARPVAFAEGALVPVRGVPHRIVATGRLRGHVESAEENGEPVLLVPGETAHHRRRIIDWMKNEALVDLTRQTGVHAARLRVSVRSIRLRSQSTRWGSCSSTGNLNYNWRLIGAPGHVLDYVAAHEVAHLVEMNHSPAFWATVKRTLPDMEHGKAWLKAHGRELMTLGA
jgi:predicted metal-dependent hydrolase